MAWWQGPFHPQSHHRVILGKYHKHRLTQHMSTNKSHFYLFKRLGFMSAFISLKNNKVALCFKKKKGYSMNLTLASMRHGMKVHTTLWEGPRRAAWGK